MAHRKRVYLIIQLHEKSVTFATGKKSGSSFDCSNIVTHQLSNLEIFGGRIFSPTYIHGLLKDFAQAHQMTKPRLIVSIHFLPEQITHFQLLQTILCLSKQGFILEHVSQSSAPSNDDTYPSSKQLMRNTNLLEAFLPTGYHTTAYLAVALGIILLALCITIGILHKSTTAKLNNEEQKANVLSKTIKELQGKVKALHDIEQQNTELTNKITTLTTLEQTKNNPHDLLLTIAQAMPPQSKLVSLHIGKEKSKIQASPKKSAQPKKKKLVTNTPFELKGLTHDPEEISNLVKVLSKKFPNTTFSLRHTNPTESTAGQTDTEPPFKFIIHVAAN